jgi:hypothetical protein
VAVSFIFGGQQIIAGIYLKTFDSQKLYNIYMGRFGQMMIYFGKKWGRLGRGSIGNGGVLTCIHHLPLFAEHEVNHGTLNIFINIIKIRYLRLTVA